MNNQERDKLFYTLPDSLVLRNKLGISDSDELEFAELSFVSQRILEGVPTGEFNLKHLQDIHFHLFQDVYEWAGEIRKVDISKGGSGFLPKDLIETAMADVQRRLAEQHFLRGLDVGGFATQAAEYIGDVNRTHPFREGNGRTQFQYLKQLGEQAGHDIDLTQFEQESWIEASKNANRFDMRLMVACIAKSIG